MPRLDDPIAIGMITLVACVASPAAGQTIITPPAPPPPPLQAPAPDALASRAMPRGSPRSWLSTEDYPAAALQAGERGLVRAVLTIDPNGRVTACLIATPSGSATLDETTCAILRRRARFSPARNHRGEPVEDSWLYRFEWTPPAG